MKNCLKVIDNLNTRPANSNFMFGLQFSTFSSDNLFKTIFFNYKNYCVARNSNISVYQSITLNMKLDAVFLTLTVEIQVIY